VATVASVLLSAPPAAHAPPPLPSPEEEEEPTEQEPAPAALWAKLKAVAHGAGRA